MVVVVLLASLPAAVRGQPSDDAAFFETRIRPVLVRHCYECHSSAAAEVKGGLLVDFRDGLRKGGDSGAAVVPGNPDGSLLLSALRHESFEMPPAGKLPDDVVSDFETWIRSGAADPRDEPPSPVEAAEQAWKIALAERSQWWSLQPLKNVVLPDTRDPERVAEPVDRFIRAKLDEAGLAPAPPADALTLLRRLSFVLIGLPPSPEEVETFPAEFAAGPDAALAALVDRLLESPHFGERFARHWMDVVRYTDTYGYEWDNPAKGSWEYRDYLIRAFNNDVGFDQLVREQIAGDLLPEPRIDPCARINESLIGPMFYHLGEHRHGSSLDFNGIHQEMVNNKIDAFSKAFLALTVACSRCHDHKLDAVSQADYYALAGVFMSPRWTSRVIDAPGRYDAQIAELERLRDEVGAALAARWRRHVEQGGLSGHSLKQWANSNAAALEKLTIGDVAYPISRLLNATDATLVPAWHTLAEEWTAARDAFQSDVQKFTLLTDFSQPGFPDGWVTEGDGIAYGYVNDGAPLVSLEGEALVTQLLPRGYHTHALSSKLPGAVRLPDQHQLPGKFISLRLQGGAWAGLMVVPQNAFQNEPLTFFDPEAPARWLEVADRDLKNGVTRVLTEVMTAALHPNFPPRTGLAKAGKTVLADSDSGLDKRSWFSLTGIAAHDAPGSPSDDRVLALQPLCDGEPPATRDEAWQRIADWFTAAVNRWCAGESSAHDVRLINWLLEHKLLPNSGAAAEEAGALVEEYRAVEAQIGFPRTCNSMDERGIEPIDYRLNVRGNPDEEGPKIRRNFIEVFADRCAVGRSARSGRLELAQYLGSAENPQTARVYVNRVWQWVFGTGIVATSSDFGKLGDRPSHPELLDWLAARFIEEGWSTKRLVRRLVLSRTFRQSGAAGAQGIERDPDNRLLHHFPTRRLEAEAIRDSVLAVSGRLDPTLYGPPIKPPRAAQDPAKRLFSGPLDGNGRRSIYLEMSIMEPPKLLVGFNLPDLKLPTGRRDVTNVPAQALMLLNDPFVVEASRRWGARLVQDGSQSAEERLRSMFVRALGRPPTDAELARWTAAAARMGSSTALLSDLDAWSQLAHTLMNTKEFVYYR